MINLVGLLASIVGAVSSIAMGYQVPALAFTALGVANWFYWRKSRS